jgi:hypothetical protein
MAVTSAEDPATESSDVEHILSCVIYRLTCFHQSIWNGISSKVHGEFYLISNGNMLVATCQTISQNIDISVFTFEQAIGF